MNLKNIFQGGLLFLVGIIVGFQVSLFYISNSPNISNVNIPNISNISTLSPPIKDKPCVNENEKEKEKEGEDKYKQMNKEFMNMYPNPCVPLGNKQVACLPNYIILGAMKAGTTFIDHYLQEHPRMAKHMKKEIFFFSQQHGNGVQWYSNHFSEVSIGDGQLIGEATPVYLGWPLAPERVRITVPNVKLIISLRDPVERAQSQYFHSIRWLKSEENTDLWQSFEQLLEEEIRVYKHCNIYPGAVFPSFMENIAKEKEVFYKQCYENCEQCFPYNNSLHGAGNPAFGLLAKSLYYYQIENWFRVFPRDQFLFVKYEDLGNQAQTVLGTIQEFLNIEPYQYATLKPQNANKYSEMNSDTRQKLNDFFREHTLKLFDILGPKNIYSDWDSMTT